MVRIVYAALGAGSTPVWVARESGLFEAEGLDVEVELVRGSRAAAAALLEGRAEFGNFAAPAVVEAATRGGDIVFLTGGINWLIQALITASGIDRVEDLGGRTLAVGEPGDHQENLLRYLLGQHGLELGRDIATAVTADQPGALAAMDAGAIDGALFSPPYTFLAVRRGHRVLIDAAEQRIPYQLGGIVASRSYVERHPDVVERVVRAYVTAVHHFLTRPEEAIGIYRKYSLLDDEDVARQCWEAMRRYFQPAPYPTVPGMQAVIDHVATRAPHAARLLAADMLDLRWVAQLENTGFISRLYQHDREARRPT